MKNKFRNILIILLILIVIGQGAGIYFLYTERENDRSYIKEFEEAKFEKLSFVSEIEKNYDITEYEAMQAVEKQPKPIEDLDVSGWIPDWDFADGFTTLRNNSDFFTSVNPFWYDLKPDGSLETLSPANNVEFNNYTKNNQIELLPTITSFDAADLSEVLRNPENMNRHISSIVEVVTENNFDGIDLDYEAVYLKDKAAFFDFLQKLSIEMINANKKLTFTAQPKWGEEVYYGGLPQTRMVFDYKRIADLVDELRIMTYEFSGRDSLYYGPNAPLDWVEDIIRFAIVEGVPRDKIVIGSPTYSYDYTLREKMPNLEYYPLALPRTSSEEVGLAYYNNIIDQIKSNNNYKEEFNEEWGEMVFFYDFEGRDRVIVYPNSESIKLRKQLAADYGIKGIAFWRLGDEGSLSYTE